MVERSSSLGQRRARALLLAGLVVAGCEASVVSGPDENDGSADGDSSAVAGSTASGVGQGRGDGSGAGGGGASCLATSDRAIQWQIITPEGVTVNRQTLAPAVFVERVVEGRIVEVTPSAFTVDACPSNADCAPMLTRFELTMNLQPIEHRLRAGTLVRVVAQTSLPSDPVWELPARALALTVTNLDAWEGDPQRRLGHRHHPQARGPQLHGGPRRVAPVAVRSNACLVASPGRWGSFSDVPPAPTTRVGPAVRAPEASRRARPAAS